ncbi:phosphoribosylglycinamide formyltransferase [Pseudaestuariivita atlantica]|uniref:Phosphoribosylglycinamide formyltransferase n=2 Tax=Pseudaestuariivita atlantica TaxID=1317121 RepID=A0A0L1JMF5_9RHOB|nr:phosphoribosylglycinamide formyltransferase [Pseudaestuariivita atlantica]
MVALVRSMVDDHPARPCLVLANSADAGGLARAAEMGVETAVVDHRPFKGDRPAFEAVLHDRITEAAPDIICLAGFMRVLTAGFVDRWSGRMLNIHPSLLPKYRGLDTHARALAAGETEHGCTVHEVTPHLDDGPILGQAKVPVVPGEAPETLAARVLAREHELYPAVLRRFASGDRTPIHI